MAGPIPGVSYKAAGLEWIARGRPSLATTNPLARDQLVWGTYKPGPDTVGPYTVETFGNQYAAAGANGYINLTVPGVYTGIRFWGTVRPQVAGITFRECIFAGPDPTTLTAIRGSIQNYGSNPKIFEAYDCRFDQSEWLQPYAPGGARAQMSPYTLGIHGGQFRVYRSEIVNAQDGVNHIGPSTDAAAIAAETVLQQSWVHKGYYTNDWYTGAADDGQPHCDGFQSNYGRNVSLLGNTIGGQRVPVGYNTWPGGYNAGDDMWNAALMLKQETGWTEERHKILNWRIEGNWLGGGTATINHAYILARPNTWAGSVIKNNKFVRRQPGWGVNKRGDGPGLPGYQVGADGALGWYVLKNAPLTAAYSGNVFEDTGDPIPITTVSGGQ